MQSVYAPSPGLRALGEVARALAALGRAADDLAVTVLARLGAFCVGLPLLRRRYVRPLHRRSRALRGATVKLHHISLARDPRCPRERARQPLSFHWIEITVRPPRRHRAPPWRPGDLALVAAAARPGCPERDEAVGRVHGVALWRNGYWVEHGLSPGLVGPQRLRLLVGVAPGTRHFRFRYYLELLRREARRGASVAPPRPTRHSAPARPARRPARSVGVASLERSALGSSALLTSAGLQAPRQDLDDDAPVPRQGARLHDL